METSDPELVRLFVKNRSEDAFRQMVNRHLNLVFATARRIVGDPQLAEEVAQGVFVLLARKAGEIKSAQPLAGWLYHTTRHQALNASRSECRRRQREQTAAAMQPNETNPAPELISAELEEVMDELSADDRDTLVLRFLDGRQLRDVGTELGVSEEAARKRVNRALEKLRGIFGKRGIALSTGLLATALAGEAGTAAPVALGTTITATALSQLAGFSATATTITATQGAMNTMNLLNLKTVAAILGVAALTGTSTYLVKEREADKLRTDYQSLQEVQAKRAKDQQGAMVILFKFRKGCCC
jgi:RNA polymerase sigma factor (sigma-70 family)